MEFSCVWTDFDLIYIYIVDSSTKYFVDLQQCKGHPFLSLHGKNERFYINCYVRLTTVQREGIVAFT
jgi:hypothetical protein